MECFELENVHIATPCKIPWDSMHGDELVRYCSQCHLNVYNIKQMTRRQASELLGLDDNICVRLFRRTDGTIITKDCPVGVKDLAKTLRLTMALLGALFTGSVLFHTLYLNELQSETEFAGRPERLTETESFIKGKVVYVLTDIDANSVITKDQVTEFEISQSKIPAIAMNSWQEVVGRISRYSIPAGQIVLSDHLYPAGQITVEEK